MKRLFCLLSLVLCAAPALAEQPVVVIANKTAPTEHVDPQVLAQIFLKQVQTWPNGAAVNPIDLKEGSALRAEFYAKITGRTPAQLRAYWARQAFTGMGLPPVQAATPADAARLVQTTPGAVGYVSRKEADSAVKVILEPGH